MSTLVACFLLIALATADACELQVNCTLCAQQSGCAWCVTERGAQSTGACVLRTECGRPGTKLGECPSLYDMPCYNAIAGDVCMPPLVPELNPAGSARRGGRVLHGEFPTLSGLRSSVPEMMCLPDGRLGRLGECLCRNHTALLAINTCREPNTTLVSDRDVERLCTALRAYRTCMANAVGRDCFVERYDHVCARLDRDNLLARHCTACNSLHDQTTTTFVMSHAAPECRLPTGQCVRPIYHDFSFRKQTCRTNATQSSVIDDAFGAWIVARMQRNSRALQFDRTHECLALYWASAARYHWLLHRPGMPMPAGWAPYEHHSSARGQYIDDTRRLAAPDAPPLDWALALDLELNVSASELAGVLQLERCRFALVLAWREQADGKTGVLDAELSKRYRFLLDHDLTRRARAAASTALLKTTVRVFLRQNMASPAPFPAFLATTIDTVQWNERIPYAGRWLRVYVPRGLDWLGARVVISIHSDRKYIEWRASVRETWLARARQLGFLAVFVVCEPDAALIAEADQFNDIVAIEAPYVYHTDRSVLPVLEHVWFQLATRHAVDAHWVMKTDHDTVLFPDALARFLRNQSTDPLRDYVYAGLFFEVAPVRQAIHRSYVSPKTYAPLQYPGFMSGGAGYLESIALARCLTAHTATTNFNYFPRSDVGMRLALNEAGCAPLLIVSSPRFRADAPTNVPNNTITVHYVKDSKKLRHYWAPHLAQINHP